MLTLPAKHRELFQEPFGSLYPDFSDILPLLYDRVFCTVGDVVTKNAFVHGLVPAVAVIDGVTKRSDAVSLPAFSGNLLEVKNPAGCIADELIVVLRQACASRPSLVMVDGEEDLAVLPLIEMLPDGAVILYGQPNEGVVFCEVNEKLRKTAQSLLAVFEVS